MRREARTERQLKLDEVMTTSTFPCGSEACVSRSKGGTGLKSQKWEGGWTHVNSPESRRRRRKGNPVPGPPCHWGHTCTET
jgi:hypothetical protein